MADTDYAADLLKSKAPASDKTTDYASTILGTQKAAPAVSTPDSPSAGYYGGSAQAVKDVAADLPGHLLRAVRGFWEGATDIPVGLAQLATHYGPDRAKEAVDHFIKDREKNYQDSRGAYADDTDVGRLTGSVVATLPAGGGAAAATLPARMVQGAKVGAALGATQIVNPGSENFALDKAIQVGAGAASGAVAVPVAELAVKAAGATVNAVSNFLKGLPARATNKTTQDAIEQTLTVEMKNAGLDFGSLSKQARDSMILETQKALKAGGEIDPDAVRRIADFKALDMDPTRGQASRNPYDFANERNLGKTASGAPLARRFDQQNRQLITGVDTARADTGSLATDSYDAGKRVMGQLQTVDDGMKATVDAAYTKARDNLGRAAPMDSKTFTDNANLALDEGMLGHYVPPEIRNIMNDVAAGKIPFNVNTAVQIDSVLSSAQRSAGAGSPQALAIGKVRDALNKAPIESNVGEDAKAAFDAARGKAKARFEKIESIPALSDMLKNKEIPPEDFVNNYVIKGSVDDVRTLMNNLPPGARRDVRGAVVDWLKSKGVNGADEVATFSQAGFNKALDQIGERNLKSIFEDSPEIMAQLRRIGRVAAYVQKAPVSSGVNYSSSGTALIDMLDKVLNLPGISAIVGKPSDIATASAVSRSLSPASPTVPAKPFLTMEQIEDAARATGRIAAPAAAIAR